MDNTLLKQSIDRWQAFYQRKRSELISRPVPKAPSTRLASALIGVRRCGKTSSAILMSREVSTDQVLYYNFEDPLFADSRSALDIDTLIEVTQQYRAAPLELLILDEIQNISGWERWLRTVIDQERYRIIITGSSATLLGSEIATSLTGRCLESKVWPLSYSEYLSFTNQEPTERLLHLSTFQQYTTCGGFPEVVRNRDDPERSVEILRQYLSDITLKDIVARHEVRQVRLLQQIITYYLTNCSSLHSYTATAKAFASTNEIVGRYTSHISDAFLIFEVERFHDSLKVQARDPRKMYCIDLSLRAATARTRSSDYGKELENLVFLELLRRKHQVMYFKGEQEVDFVILDKYQPVAAIQVCWDLREYPATKKREVSAIKKCMKALNLDEGYIITKDHEEILVVPEGTIRIVPAWEWMLPNAQQPPLQPYQQ